MSKQHFEEKNAKIKEKFDALKKQVQKVRSSD